MIQDGRIVPNWTYRPGPDTSFAPPRGLVRAQEIARGAAAAGCAAANPGASERDIELAVSDYLRSRGITEIWTITNVGVGGNAHICFPTRGPTDLTLGASDVALIDVHPLTPDGVWGDCTRCKVIGDNRAAADALAELTAIYDRCMASAKPGTPAHDLFGGMHQLMVSAGFTLLDELGNIGHSLTSGAAYLEGFIDAGNATPMWGCWAVEPFAEREGSAVKVEDLWWFGRDECIKV